MESKAILFVYECESREHRTILKTQAPIRCSHCQSPMQKIGYVEKEPEEALLNAQLRGLTMQREGAH